MAGLVVKPRARILHGHDWVFSGEVLKVFGNPTDGDVISLKDGKDRLIGSALYNSKSQIVARRFSRRRQDLDLDFFQRRIGQAVEYRQRRGIDPRLCRMVWSEMDQRKESIVEALKTAGSGQDLQSIIERNDAPVRKAEGMETQVGVLFGEPLGETEIEVAGLRLTVDLMQAQKTGFYLDQLSHYHAVANQAKGRRVLDCFTSQGPFALACAKAGAASVAAVEASGESLASARRNAERNNLQVEWIEQDVFAFLRAAEKSGAEFDLIILDPPSFTKTKGGLHDALRGYRELHVRAFNLLSKDGLLATFSCSHHVTEKIFDETIADALVDARRSARRLRRFEQALDHPVLPTLPETEYFKGVLLEMMPGR